MIWMSLGSSDLKFKTFLLNYFFSLVFFFSGFFYSSARSLRKIYVVGGFSYFSSAAVPRTQTDTSSFGTGLISTGNVTSYLFHPPHLVSLNCCLQITEAGGLVYARHSAQSTPAAAWATAHWTGFLQSFGSLGTPSLLHHPLPTSWNQPQTYLVPGQNNCCYSCYIYS